MQHRFLTKSLFKLASECPTKLYYEGKPGYANKKDEDSLLMALVEGGFQVSALAKCYYPNGHEIETKDYDDAVFQTKELLKLENVVIFEAAVRFENLFIRIDILIKNKNNVELIEVKAKSFDSNADNFLTDKGFISSAWQSYLYDVGFQKYVYKCAYPDYNVSAFLMMADKNAKCPTDGLNQKFRIVKDDIGKKSVSVSPDLSPEDLSTPLLIKVTVDSCCEVIYNNRFEINSAKYSFVDYVTKLSEHYLNDQRIPASISKTCANCEFKATEDDLDLGLKCGFHECWKENLNWIDNDFLCPTVLDIWNYRKKDHCINDGRIKLADITEQDISPKKDGKPGISTSERQWMQVKKAQNDDRTEWVDLVNLKAEMDKWIYPLHFIDFETSMVAIPFNKGRHPYEGIAFQFSHHMVHQDGQIEHHGEYLNIIPGFFPNYEFVLKLKNELGQDGGSIFRYAAHENTYLNFIYQQLNENSIPIPEKESLCDFIREVTKSSSSCAEQWLGKRNMIDMLELVKRYYYNPMTSGSNSIKYILPAILNSSKFLQKKYSDPVYGAEGGIRSLNYHNWKWIEFENGKVIDPYKLMPRMFSDISDKDIALLSDDDELRNGGAALAAYARLQFEEMSAYERQEIRKALLKYCELDTFAMVMIYEGWKDLVNKKK